MCPHNSRISQAAQEKYDIVVAAIMILGTVYYSLYFAKFASNFVAKASYSVYDGASVSSANWLLPLRQNPPLVDYSNNATVSSLPPEIQAVLTKAQAVNLSMPVTPDLNGRYESRAC